jgi:sugar fermentation stimulation protein
VLILVRGSQPVMIPSYDSSTYSFTNYLVGTFVNRPNRFVIQVKLEGSKEISTAYCPNPGRMLELFHPDLPVLLSQSPSADAKHPLQLVGVQYRNQFVPVHTGLANKLAQDLILPELFPQGTIQPEVTFGDSRLDFVVHLPKNRRVVVEVKNCSLVEHSVALFPDAPSPRAAKHIGKLDELRAQGWEPLLLIVVTHSNPQIFRPLVHTDPAFALSLFTHQIPIRVVSLSWNQMGKLVNKNFNIPADLTVAKLATSSKGLIIGGFQYEWSPQHGLKKEKEWFLTWDIVEDNFQRVITNPSGWFNRTRGKKLFGICGKPTKQRFWTLADPHPSGLRQELETVVEGSTWKQIEPRVYYLGDQAPEWYRPLLDVIFRVISCNNTEQ